MSRFGLVLFVGICVVGGQVSLARFARSLTPPWSVGHVLPQALASPWLWLAGAIYLVGLAVYAWLLRTGAISATNVPLLAVVLVLNIAIAFHPSEGLSAMQIAGVVLTGLGLILIQLG